MQGVEGFSLSSYFPLVGFIICGPSTLGGLKFLEEMFTSLTDDEAGLVRLCSKGANIC